VYTVSASRATAIDRRPPRAAFRRLDLAAAAVPATLYGLCLAVYAWASSFVGFAANEGSAYYVAAARNLASGRGLVVDAIWSYATPPLVLPRPAFELWQPLASIVMALPMPLIGTSLDAAQLAMAALGAALAPLAWLTAGEACAVLGIDGMRRQSLAAGSGLLVALTGPLLLAVALPDSTIPFAVTATACCWLLARSLTPSADPVRARLWFALGIGLGLCWLARHEAVWLALLAVLAAIGARILSRRLLAAVVAGGLLVSVPWLIRNALTFGTPLPGQALDNALLVSNEQIFAYLERPSLAGFIDQGLPTLLGNVGAALWHNVVDVVLVPAAPLAVAGLLAGAALLRRSEMRTSTLGLLLGAGGLMFAVSGIAFPVASRWGTFAHASGPLLVGLAVAAVIGLDMGIQAVGRRRGWRNGNAWLAPAALAVLVLPLSVLQVTGLGAQAEARAEHYAALAAAVRQQPEIGRHEPGPTLISEHPVWLADATGLTAVALPAEPLESVIALASRFDAPLLVISDPRGPYPAALRGAEAARCFSERPPLPGQPAGTAIFAIAADCRR
jgi:hypothetical protein